MLSCKIFSLDVRWTVKQLKEQLSAKIEKSQESFHLLLPDGKALAEEEKKLKVSKHTLATCDELN